MEWISLASSLKQNKKCKANFRTKDLEPMFNHVKPNVVKMSDKHFIKFSLFYAESNMTIFFFHIMIILINFNFLSRVRTCKKNIITF